MKLERFPFIFIVDSKCPYRSWRRVPPGRTSGRDRLRLDASTVSGAGIDRKSTRIRTKLRLRCYRVGWATNKQFTPWSDCADAVRQFEAVGSQTKVPVPLKPSLEYSVVKEQLTPGPRKWTTLTFLSSVAVFCGGQYWPLGQIPGRLTFFDWARST